MKQAAASIELHKTEKGASFFTVRVEGKLDRDDFAEFVPQLEWQITSAGRIDLLIELAGFRGWTMRALWEGVKFCVKHFKTIGRIAVVGRGTLMEHGVAALLKPLTGAEVRYFRAAQKDSACRWIEREEAAIPKE